jgi:HlyD family secretion protein
MENDTDMKRLLPFLLLLVAACKPAGLPHYLGYAEGEWLYLSTPQGGYLETLHVERGDHPAKGSIAFTLSGDQNARRSAQLDALQAQLHAAESALASANAQLKRQQELERDKFASPARTDELQAVQKQAAAQVRVLREQLANKSMLIPVAGEVTEIYYRPGEWVPPGQPVLSLLPDNRRRIRFYVPEAELARVQIGQAIEASCDGCGTPIAAHVNFISSQAEYTPPVIFSKDERNKTVFRIEAVASAEDASRLRPGLPMEIRLK